MATSKVENLNALTTVAATDVLYIVDNPDVSPQGKKITKANLVKDIAITDLANGTDGELITWNASGVAEAVAVGTATDVLTSNGAGAAPTFQAAAAGGSIPDVLYDSTFIGTTPVTAVTSATINTFGAWVEYSADIGTGKKLLGISFKSNNTTTLEMCEIEVGEGAAASEAAVARISSMIVANNGFFLPLNRTLTTSARIAVRVRQSGDAADNNYGIALLVGTA